MMEHRTRGGYPSTRRLDRELSLTQARRRLEDYVLAVATALRTAGTAVTDMSVTSQPYLTARMQLRVGPSWASTAVGDRRESDPPHAAEPEWVAELEWAEDTGWSLTHPGCPPDPSVWRYLHSELAPAPRTVVRFVHDTMSDPARAERFPQRFRHYSQPLRELIEQLSVDHARVDHPRVDKGGGTRSADSVPHLGDDLMLAGSARPRAG